SPSVATRSHIGSIEVHPLINADRDAEAAQVVDIVRDTQASNRDATIAILVSTRTRVGAIARELTRAGIEFQAVEIERLYDRPIVQELIALPRALVHLADRSAWLAVLRAPWCGVQWADLYAIATWPVSTIQEALQAAVEGQIHALSASTRQRLSRTHA